MTARPGTSWCVLSDRMQTDRGHRENPEDMNPVSTAWSKNNQGKRRWRTETRRRFRGKKEQTEGWPRTETEDRNGTQKELGSNDLCWGSRGSLMS